MKKVSLITLTKNSDETLINCLNSGLQQDYNNIEFIFVDARSKDRTLSILNAFPRKKKILTQKSIGLYSALNEGIEAASGEIIGLLHSDDVLNEKDTISKVVKKMNKSNSKIFLGDIIYFKDDPNKISRYYSVKKFKISDMKYGLMPPHTGAFIKKEVYKKNQYNNSFKIAGDFDFFFKVLFLKKLPYEKLGFITTRMKIGGLSTGNLSSYFAITNELRNCYVRNKINHSLLRSIIRTPLKLRQLIFDKKKLKKFKILDSEFLKLNSQFSFKLLKNFKNLHKYNNYILAALNLAFLGFFSQRKISNNKSYLLWPDGVFFKLIRNTNIKKNPGRLLFKQFILPKNCKNITVLGNLTNKSKKFLNEKFKIQIKNIVLPYGPSEKIISFLKKIKFSTNKYEVIFVTLPTPKQEQIAEYIASKNKIFKVICIGASVAIASGEEKKVPEIFTSIEFIWRLRYETTRRLSRLFQTYFYYIKDRFTLSRINQIKLRIVK